MPLFQVSVKFLQTGQDLFEETVIGSAQRKKVNLIGPHGVTLGREARPTQHIKTIFKRLFVVPELHRELALRFVTQRDEAHTECGLSQMVKHHLEAGPEERHVHRVGDQAWCTSPQVDLVVVCCIKVLLFWNFDRILLALLAAVIVRQGASRAHLQEWKDTEGTKVLERGNMKWKKVRWQGLLQEGYATVLLYLEVCQLQVANLLLLVVSFQSRKANTEPFATVEEALCFSKQVGTFTDYNFADDFGALPQICLDNFAAEQFLNTQLLYFLVDHTFQVRSRKLRFFRCRLHWHRLDRFGYPALGFVLDFLFLSDFVHQGLLQFLSQIVASLLGWLFVFACCLF